MRIRCGLKIYLIFFGLVYGLATAVFAAGTSTSFYDLGIAANMRGDYQKANILLEQALIGDGNNPDILNMLANTQLKLGLFYESQKNYSKALALLKK
ncbi:MAG: tetratricopeptide repeat protein [Candidatus Omnitrophica bacterium]|nr:tetratricopeptide repeat protein [Candidatus Omnitrophota bacterium]